MKIGTDFPSGMDDLFTVTVADTCLHVPSEPTLVQHIYTSDERIVGNRLLNNRIPNVIGSYDYHLRKVIVTK